MPANLVDVRRSAGVAATSGREEVEFDCGDGSGYDNE
jgi:hypothetical protein